MTNVMKLMLSCTGPADYNPIQVSVAASSVHVTSPSTQETDRQRDGEKATKKNELKR